MANLVSELLIFLGTLRKVKLGISCLPVGRIEAKTGPQGKPRKKLQSAAKD